MAKREGKEKIEQKRVTYKRKEIEGGGGGGSRRMVRDEGLGQRW